VLFVSQISFLMSTFKYVCAVFLRLSDLNGDDRQAMGWILVLLDVVFMLASVVAFVLVVVFLRAIDVGNATTKDNTEVLEEENERSVDRRSPQSMAKVVPAQQQQQQQRSMLQNEIVALKWQKNIRQTLVKNTPKAKLGRVKSRRTRKVEEIERNHQSHRNMAVQNIKQQQVQRRNSLQLRVQARNQRKNARETVAVNKNASCATVKIDDGATMEQVLIQQDLATTAAVAGNNNVATMVTKAKDVLRKMGRQKIEKIITKLQTTGENNCLNKRKLAGLLIKLGVTDKKAMQQCLNEMMTTGSKQIKGNNFLQWVFMEGKELDPKKLEARTVQVETPEPDSATHIVHIDPATGQQYSIDKNTGESTWVVEK
jgi:hypothetical protein